MKDHLGQLVGGQTPLRGRNIVREYLQARILGALQRAGAMTSLAFHGGTSLRFLFGLPRYSEDLDFALEGDAFGGKPLPSGWTAWIGTVRRATCGHFWNGTRMRHWSKGIPPCDCWSDHCEPSSI